MFKKPSFLLALVMSTIGSLNISVQPSFAVENNSTYENVEIISKCVPVENGYQNVLINKEKPERKPIFEWNSEELKNSQIEDIEKVCNEIAEKLQTHLDKKYKNTIFYIENIDNNKTIVCLQTNTGSCQERLDANFEDTQVLFALTSENTNDDNTFSAKDIMNSIIRDEYRHGIYIEEEETTLRMYKSTRYSLNLWEILGLRR